MERMDTYRNTRYFMPNRIIAIQYLHVEMTRELTGELTNA